MEISAAPYVIMILGTFGASLFALVGLIVSDQFSQTKYRPVNAQARASRAQSNASCKQPVAA